MFLLLVLFHVSKLLLQRLTTGLIYELWSMVVTLLPEPGLIKLCRTASLVLGIVLGLDGGSSDLQFDDHTTLTRNE